MPNVSSALIRASKQLSDDEDPIYISPGGYYSRADNDDSRFRADWAGMKPSQKIRFGYMNLYPGETKLSTK